MKRKKTRRYISGMIVAVLLFLLCVVQNVNAEDVPAGSELPRLVDDADILTDSEEKELNQQLDTVSEEQECDVIIVTEWRCDHGVYGCRACIHGRPVRTRSE